MFFTISKLGINEMQFSFLYQVTDYHETCCEYHDIPRHHSFLYVWFLMVSNNMVDLQIYEVEVTIYDLEMLHCDNNVGEICSYC
jgi:hypothetical protein